MTTDSKVNRQRLALLEEKERIIKTFPHRYAWKHYDWSRKFFECKEKEAYLVAANQVGKSSVNIRQCIEWATNPNIWPELWAPGMGQPNQFWYCYPTKEVATIEFKTKWSQFLPQGKFQDNDMTGWKPQMETKFIKACHFNSGVSIYFKTYAQHVKDLQSGTVYALFWDEEMPVELLPELQARLNATDGYMRGVFTATLGQEHWRRCMEEKGTLETHKDALKLNVSLYDCLFFEDGSASHWTHEKIKRAIAKCPTEAEIQRRIYGRFVSSSGRKYEAFNPKRNRCGKFVRPPNWVVYSAVDIGSGGLGGHPAAIVFIAISPDYTQGKVLKCWRGDQIVTTDADIYKQYREMRRELRCSPIGQAYDWHAKDFFTITSRMGDSFVPAEKSHDIGEGILNTLFKHNMLQIPTEMYEEDQLELEKLVGELSSLLNSTPKTQAADDLCDALRYAVCQVPWDFSSIDLNLDFDAILEKDLKPPKKKVETESERIDRERAEWAKPRNANLDSVEAELDYWNEMYDT